MSTILKGKCEIAGLCLSQVEQGMRKVQQITRSAEMSTLTLRILLGVGVVSCCKPCRLIVEPGLVTIETMQP